MRMTRCIQINLSSLFVQSVGRAKWCLIKHHKVVAGYGYKREMRVFLPSLFKYEQRVSLRKTWNKAQVETNKNKVLTHARL